MRVAPVEPPWSFEGSVCFGWREPHLPSELGCSAAMLDTAGHRTPMLDAHLCGSGMADTAEAVAEFRLRGECEEVPLRLAEEKALARLPAATFRDGGEIRITGAPYAGEFSHFAALRWPDGWVHRHRQRHHRFEARPVGSFSDIQDEHPLALVELEALCPQ